MKNYSTSYMAAEAELHRREAQAEAILLERGLSPSLIPRRQNRRKIRFYDFVQEAWHIIEPSVPFVPGWHLEAKCLHFEAVAEHRISNLLICEPPSCCKSIISSVLWPAWRWTEDPSARFMFASYSQELSNRDSARCRQVLMSAWYRQHWGDLFALTDDQNQKIKFENTARGWRLATSIGGRGTGEHPDYIVVDDAMNAKDADSPAAKRKVKEWWRGTMPTRGMGRRVGRVVLGQRLANDDLPGIILENEADKWEKLILPMEYEPGRMNPTCLGWSDPRQRPGELLWPQMFGASRVDDLKKNMTHRHAAGQFQQRPQPAEGNHFHPESWPKWVDGGDAYGLERPNLAVRKDACPLFVIVDPAISESHDADYTAIITFAVTPDGALIVVSVDRERLAVDKIVSRLGQVCDYWRPVFVGIESSGFFTQLIRDARSSPHIPEVRTFSPQGRGKLARAYKAILKGENGRIYLPAKPSPWLDEFKAELAAFTGANDPRDDQVDCLSYAALAADDLTADEAFLPEAFAGPARGSGGAYIPGAGGGQRGPWGI